MYAICKKLRPTLSGGSFSALSPRGPPSEPDAGWARLNCGTKLYTNPLRIIHSFGTANLYTRLCTHSHIAIITPARRVKRYAKNISVSHRRVGVDRAGGVRTERNDRDRPSDERCGRAP